MSFFNCVFIHGGAHAFLHPPGVYKVLSQSPCLCLGRCSRAARDFGLQVRMIQPSIKLPVSLLPQHIQRIHSARARPRRQRWTPIASLLPAAAATAAAASLQLSRRAIMAGAAAAKGASTATCNAGSESEKSCQLYVPSAHELGFDQEAFRQGKLSIVILGATGDLAKKAG